MNNMDDYKRQIKNHHFLTFSFGDNYEAKYGWFFNDGYLPFPVRSSLFEFQDDYKRKSIEYRPTFTDRYFGGSGKTLITGQGEVGLFGAQSIQAFEEGWKMNPERDCISKYYYKFLTNNFYSIPANRPEGAEKFYGQNHQQGVGYACIEINTSNHRPPDPEDAVNVQRFNLFVKIESMITRFCQEESIPLIRIDREVINRHKESRLEEEVNEGKESKDVERFRMVVESYGEGAKKILDPSKGLKEAKGFRRELESYYDYPALRAFWIYDYLSLLPEDRLVAMAKGENDDCAE